MKSSTTVERRRLTAWPQAGGNKPTLLNNPNLPGCGGTHLPMNHPVSHATIASDKAAN
jgi:hypothetical protein